jgi:hypothetical protein
VTDCALPRVDALIEELEAQPWRQLSAGTSRQTVLWCPRKAPDNRLQPMKTQPVTQVIALDSAQAHRRGRSLRKLTKAMGALLERMGQPPPDGPPANW